VTIFGIFFTPVFYVVIRWFVGPKAATPGSGAKEVPAATLGKIDASLIAKHGITSGRQAEMG
jgi:hypothetical protein